MDNRNRILDIAMNLNRVGDWAADDFDGKKPLISLFLNQTAKYSKAIKIASLPKTLGKTFEDFLEEYKELKKEGENGPKDTLYWAEKMMTWGNILTHRANLIKE